MIPSVDKDVGAMKTHTVGENVNWYIDFGEQSGFIYQIGRYANPMIQQLSFWFYASPNI